MTAFKKYTPPPTILAALILTCAMLVLASCCPPPVVIKPDPTLTMPVERVDLLVGDTVRDLGEKFEQRGLAIDTANKQLDGMR